MGARILRDVKDDMDTVPILHLRDWVKREPPDELIASRFQFILTEVAQHVDAIETFLESGAGAAGGKAFIRPQERPAVGDGALAQELKTLQQRVQSLEQSLGNKRP
jgi:hypothetical protein